MTFTGANRSFDGNSSQSTHFGAALGDNFRLMSL
jgi:hypothetical protein